ncbi:MAG: hypothetical protein IJX80_03055 [Clostridia bacterium]|nr:hypothetical protein [Clostridia bacterium]
MPHSVDDVFLKRACQIYESCGISASALPSPNMLHGYDGGEGFDVYHILLSPQYFEKYVASLQPFPAVSLLFKIDPQVRARTSAKLYFRLSEKVIDSMMPRLETLTCRSYGEGYVDVRVSEVEA